MSENIFTEDSIDKDLIKRFLSDKSYLSPLISEYLLPLSAQQKDCQDLFAFINTKNGTLRQQSLNIRVSLENEKSKTCPNYQQKSSIFYYRIVKFLNIEVFNILININDIKLSNLEDIHRSFKSLSRFSIVFPFILKKLITDMQTIERVTNSYVSKENEKKVVSLTFKSSQIRAKVIQVSNLIVTKTIPLYDFNTSNYNTTSNESFALFIDTLSDELKQKANDIIESIISDVKTVDEMETPMIFESANDDSFSEKMQSFVEQLCIEIEVGPTKKNVQKISLFAIRYIFMEVYKRGYEPFPHNITAKESNKEMTCSDLPIKDIIKNIEDTMLISDFVNGSEKLVLAKEELEMVIFENCPIDIFMRVDRSLKYAQKYISDVLKEETGTVPSFIPFDNVIQIFNAVFNTADIPGLASLLYSVSKFSCYKNLPNDLSFAHDSFIGAYSLRV